MLLSFQRKLVLSLYLQGEKGETKITEKRRSSHSSSWGGRNAYRRAWVIGNS